MSAADGNLPTAARSGEMQPGFKSEDAVTGPVPHTMVDPNNSPKQDGHRPAQRDLAIMNVRPPWRVKRGKSWLLPRKKKRRLFRGPRFGYRHANAQVVSARLVIIPASFIIRAIGANAIEQIALVLHPVNQRFT